MPICQHIVAIGQLEYSQKMSILPEVSQDVLMVIYKFWIEVSDIISFYLNRSSMVTRYASKFWILVTHKSTLKVTLAAAVYLL